MIKSESFFPTERLLLGPGPTNMHPAVLAALARPVIGHLDPEFVSFMDDLKARLRRIFQTKNTMTFPVSGPGSAGMELCVMNLIEPGDHALALVNGVFGSRLAETMERAGARVSRLEAPWGQPIDPDDLRRTLAQKHAQVVAFVHAETSTGARSDAQALARVIHDHDALAIVDCVTSLGGIPVQVDDWELDAVYAGSQKCLSCTPGLSPVTIGERAMGKINARKTKPASWFLDVKMLASYWEGETKRSYHHTAPVHTLMALHEAAGLLLGEGLESAFERHASAHRLLYDGLVNRGWNFFVNTNHRLPQLNTVIVPDHVNEVELRKKLLLEHNIEIGAGMGELAGKVLRIGLMGHNAREMTLRRLLGALDIVAKT